MKMGCRYLVILFSLIVVVYMYYTGAALMARVLLWDMYLFWMNSAFVVISHHHYLVLTLACHAMIVYWTRGLKLKTIEEEVVSLGDKPSCHQVSSYLIRDLSPECRMFLTRALQRRFELFYCYTLTCFFLARGSLTKRK
ncbi:hypothetical protein FRC03_000457 [Tulasnella sp. 419]|nr:hypothetical protein FRC03_000457 [Tulasnella sp. 419]